MSSNGTAPIADTVGVLAGKWKPAIIWLLRGGPLRYSELLAKMPTVAHKVASQQLRELKEHGVVDREVGVGGPRRVRYGLTPSGLALIPILEQMQKWGLTYANGSQSVVGQVVIKSSPDSEPSSRPLSNSFSGNLLNN